jgi:transcription antitermination factor NusG
MPLDLLAPSVSVAPSAMFPGKREWFAIQTHAKHEKKVASELGQKGITAFVPTVREVHRWSDRSKVIEAALFSCYAFVEVTLSAQTYIAILQTPGVLRWVAFNGMPCSIPGSQMEAVRQITKNQVGCWHYPFLKVGQRVRIRGGCLDGLECILVSQPDGNKLVVSIEPIHRSICIATQDYTIQPA